ncbi:hypothetical protein L2E82_51119 [Cichorium intybus]|nr:hypothetical protein L2E82_51119 [Cichorium intybus]
MCSPRLDTVHILSQRWWWWWMAAAAVVMAINVGGRAGGGGGDGGWWWMTVVVAGGGSGGGGGWLWIFAWQGIEMPLVSFKTGAILLAGLFVYDIFWVYFTPVMVSVAKSLMHQSR